MFAYNVFVWNYRDIAGAKVLVVLCKVCVCTIPAGVDAYPKGSIAVRCPLCKQLRQYRPTEVHKRMLDHRLLRRGYEP